ncbi:MAG: DUF3108 domain-containing protein [Desulfobacteraceae bacterium]|nr:DUF3108 domain-containing protein [Desulfobacteraceae bacterium]
MVGLIVGHMHNMQKMKWGLLLILTMLLAVLAFSAITHGTEDRHPFSPGEKLTFQVRWAFIPAGEAVLEIYPLETMNGRRVYHFALTARTYPVVDLIYKVRDRIDAYTDEKLSHSILYKETKEGQRKKRVVVNFDWEKGEAQRSNFGEKREPLSIKPGTFDPLSVYYALRLHDLKENMELEKPFTDGKKWILGRARVVKREEVTVLSGRYDTYLVEPSLEHIGGVFKKSKDAKLQIWVTADDRRIPVKIKSKVAVGSFVGELISVENNPEKSDGR